MLQPPDRDTPKVWQGRINQDALAISVFLVCLAINMWHRWVYDNWLSEFDIFSFFLPWFGLIGARLHEFDIPGWTPYFSSGSPVAGDPSGGWMYFPVMITFSTLSIATAFKTMIVIQTVIGGLSLYAFSRVIGYRPLAALMSTMAFGLGAFFYGQTHFATVACQVATWIPVGLLGIELAIRARRFTYAAAAVCLAGLAISQIAAAWLGQGLVNALLVMGGWVAYRTLISPPPNLQARRDRIVRMLIIGPAVLLLGLCLAAAGLLPKISINMQSSIAGGNYANLRGGDYEEERNSLFWLFRDMMIDDVGYRALGISAITLTLAIMGILLARRKHAAPFFAAVYILSCILTLQDTIVHRFFYMIPEFQQIHEHSPRRMIWVMTFAPSMLAGAAIQELPRWRNRMHAVPIVTAPAVIIGALCLFLGFHGTWVGWWVYGVTLVATILAFSIVRPLKQWADDLRDQLMNIALVFLIAISFIAPPIRDIVVGIINSNGFPAGIFLERDQKTEDQVNLYLTDSEPDSAAAFLQERQVMESPFRYVGYSGRFFPDSRINAPSYSERRRGSGPLAVLVNGRSASLGLEQIPGYNPTHLENYVEYYEAMNGGNQDYHWLDPFPSAIAHSQLFDMLGVRYIVVSRTIPVERADIRAIADGREIVYQDTEVTIYENPDAFDRAWIVHDVRPNNDGDSLALFQSDQVDAHQVGYVDGPVPLVVAATPDQVAREQVQITHYEGDRFTAVATLDVPGLVVFGEVYAKGWNAYVDGKRTDLLRTDHALRGVAVSSGTHTIELKYEPRELTVGLWISGATGLGMLGVFGFAGIAWLRTSAGSAPVPIVPSVCPSTADVDKRRRRRSRRHRHRRRA